MLDISSFIQLPVFSNQLVSIVYSYSFLSTLIYSCQHSSHSLSISCCNVLFFGSNFWHIHLGFYIYDCCSCVDSEFNKISMRSSPRNIPIYILIKVVDYIKRIEKGYIVWYSLNCTSTLVFKVNISIYK